jgi:pyruvyltransferase
MSATGSMELARDSPATRVPAFWCRVPSRPNFGDALTPWLIHRITGAYPIFLRPDDPRPKYLVTGSIVAYATRAATVWGAGIIAATDIISSEAHLLAVRGPLTRATALACGADCPEVYGDPGLLLPRFYRPEPINPQGGGLIAHFSDRPRLGAVWQGTPGLRAIDVQDPIETVIDQVVASQFVASSSLHGLIVSHAYGVPAVWIKFRDLPAGDDSKFRDYYLSIGEDSPKPLRVAYDRADPDLLAGHAKPPPALPDLDRLWQACPFRDAT